jgi:hypothetical protein
MVPSYFKEHEGKRSPLPLNLGLLWWRRVFDEADIGKPDFGKYAWIWKNLGKLGDPKIVTTFALNYYGLARGKPASGRTKEELDRINRIFRIDMLILKILSRFPLPVFISTTRAA